MSIWMDIKQIEAGSQNKKEDNLKGSINAQIDEHTKERKIKAQSNRNRS